MMRLKFLKFATALVPVIVVGVIGWHVMTPDEPAWKGKSLRGWLSFWEGGRVSP